MSEIDQETVPLLREPPEHMPDSHPDTLGHVAVRGDLEASVMEDQMRGWQKYEEDKEDKEARLFIDYYKYEAGQRREYVHDYIARARDAINWLGKQHRGIGQPAVDEFIGSLSEFQRGQYIRADGVESLFDWLTEQKALGMSESTPEERKLKERQSYEDDQRLLNFFQSHNERMARRSQSPEFEQDIEEQKAIWKDGVQRGLDEGWLHPNAEQSLDRVRSLRVYEGDYFTTLLHKRAGYFRSADVDYVSVAKGSLVHATVHEINHALLQVVPDEASEPLAEPWLYEAITEELAQTFKTGEFGAFDFDEGSYPDQRWLLRSILDISKQLKAGVDFSDFTRAYTAPVADQAEITKEISQKMYDAGYFDIDIFSGLEDLMSQIRSNIDAEPVNDHLDDIKKENTVLSIVTLRLRNWAKNARHQKHKNRHQ